MTITKKLVPLLWAVLIAVMPAVADDFCGIGLYFDEEATLRGIDADVGSVAHAYLAMSIFDGPVQLTEFVQDMIHVEGIDGCWTEFRGGAVNTHVPWFEGDLAMELHWDTPYPVDGVTVLADLYIPIEDDQPVRIFVTCYTWGSFLGGQNWSMEHCTYCDEMPPQMTLAATINSDHIPVENEESTWSAIKRIYDDTP